MRVVYYNIWEQVDLACSEAVEEQVKIREIIITKEEQAELHEYIIQLKKNNEDNPYSWTSNKMYQYQGVNIRVE